jgi:hypothetical protein
VPIFKEVNPFLYQKDVKREYVERFFKKPWEEETHGCRRCFLALFSNAALNALKLNNGESLTFGKFSKEVTPAIEGLLLAMLEVQGDRLIKLPSDVKTPNMDSNKAEVKKHRMDAPNMDSNKAEVNKHRMDALYRRIEIKKYFSKGSSKESVASSIPTISEEEEEKKEKARISHQWYLKAVDKINAIKNEINKKKRKLDSNSVGVSLEGRNEPRVRIENPPEMLFGGDPDWVDIDNPDMSDVPEIVPV